MMDKMVSFLRGNTPFTELINEGRMATGEENAAFFDRSPWKRSYETTPDGKVWEIIGKTEDGTLVVTEAE